MQIQCTVKPRSKTDGISVSADGSFKVKIKALPIDGKANEYLVEYLAGIFNVSKSKVQIVSGFTNSHKRINIVADEAFIQNTILKLKS